MHLWVAFRFNAPFPHRFLALNMPGSGFGSGICWCSGSFNIISLIQGEYYPTTPGRTKYYPTGFIIPHTFICGSLSVGTRAGPTSAWCRRQVAVRQHPESRFSRKLSRRLSSPIGLVARHQNLILWNGGQGIHYIQKVHCAWHREYMHHSCIRGVATFTLRRAESFLPFPLLWNGGRCLRYFQKSSFRWGNRRRRRYTVLNLES